MYDWLAKSFQDAPQNDDKAVMGNMLRTWWPDHLIKHIHSYQCYETIDRWLDSTRPNRLKLIFCAEEDWFTRSDHHRVRMKMAGHPHWTQDDLVITFSELDSQVTQAMGINCLWRPGLPDMVAYRPYNMDVVFVGVDNIRHHTSFLHSDTSPARYRIVEKLLLYGEKLSVMFFPGHCLNNTAAFESSMRIDPHITSAPCLDIQTDLPWRESTAFITTVETMYEGPWAPHLSEKTYKAMHLLRPALIYGGRNTRDYLRRLAFDTWDWFFDWSWDGMPDGADRLHKFQQELERLLNTPIEILMALIESNQQKLLDNRSRLQQLVKNYDADPFSG